MVLTMMDNYFLSVKDYPIDSYSWRDWIHWYYDIRN